MDPAPFDRLDRGRVNEQHEVKPSQPDSPHSHTFKLNDETQDPLSDSCGDRVSRQEQGRYARGNAIRES